MPLDTLPNVKARLGITSSADDAVLGQFQSSADDWVKNYCGRDFAGGTFVEYQPAAGPYLVLDNFPVAAVESVRADPDWVFGDDTVVPASAYVVFPRRGVIQAKGGHFRPARPRGSLDQNVTDWTRVPWPIKVTYTVTTPVPADVKEAYAQLVGHWFRRLKTQSLVGHVNVTQQRLGDATSIFAKDQIAGMPVPPDVFQLLAPYRTPPL